MKDLTVVFKDKRFVLIDTIEGQLVKNDICDIYYLSDLDNLPSNILKNPDLYIGNDKNYIIFKINLDDLNNKFFNKFKEQIIDSNVCRIFKYKPTHIAQITFYHQINVVDVNTWFTFKFNTYINEINNRNQISYQIIVNKGENIPTEQTDILIKNFIIKKFNLI